MKKKKKKISVPIVYAINEKINYWHPMPITKVIEKNNAICKLIKHINTF